MDAQEANRITEMALNKKKSERIQNILAQITARANDGYYDLFVEDDELIEFNKFTEMGYHVKDVEDQFGIPRLIATKNISW